MKKNIPNLLTFFRILAVPLFVACYFLPNAKWGAILAFTIFAAASITDWFDGFLARRWKVESALGKCFDPIADKLIVLVALYIVVWQDGAVLLPAVIIASREVVVAGLREHLAAQNVKLHVTFLAKIKTTIQMAALSAYIILPALPVRWAIEIMDGAGIWLMWTAAVLTAITGIEYTVKALKHFK